MTLKDYYQYRKYNRAAEGEKDKNCAHCKNTRDRQFITVLPFCKILKEEVKRNFLCDRFERG